MALPGYVEGAVIAEDGVAGEGRHASDKGKCLANLKVPEKSVNYVGNLA